jgi:hypothetical protein
MADGEMTMLSDINLELTEAWASGLDVPNRGFGNNVSDIIAELRARRATDLSEADKEALWLYRNRLMARGAARGPHDEAVYAALNRLLAGERQ